jgi:hypothetical protein
MTAFLLKDIAMTSTNTGEIERPRTSFPEIGALPRDTGEYTRNLGPYVAGARLAGRPGAEDTGEVPTLLTIGIVDADWPLAPLEQAPPNCETVTNLRRPVLYARTRPGGRHRKPTFWDGVWARIRGAM